jgi:hypothetical protein
MQIRKSIWKMKKVVGDQILVLLRITGEGFGVGEQASDFSISPFLF